MDKNNIRLKIDEIRNQLNYHNHRYYTLDDPIISDYEYDCLMKELKRLEDKYPEYISEDSPTKKVGGDAPLSRKAYTHKPPMLSLDNLFDTNDLDKWEEKIIKKLKYDGKEFKNIEYVVEPKIDGASCSLIYIDGELKIGALRGDGKTGEIVTSSIKKIKNIPPKLYLKNITKVPPKIEIRGEVFLNREDFDKLNEYRKNHNLSIFANPRNAASGSLKLLNPNIVARRNLRFIPHSFGDFNFFENINSFYKYYKFLKEIGFEVNPRAETCKKLSDVKDHINKIKDYRESCPFEIDGVVIKVDSRDIRNNLDKTSKSPRWAAAYKFEAHQMTTIVINIVHQVGRTGVITPVAELEPVECGGVTISRATLHNYEEVKRLDVGTGARVLVERAGDVIPKIVKVVDKDKHRKKKFIKPPEKCPACGSDVVKEKLEQVAYMCLNSACPAQIARGVEHFASRSAMDIEGLGEAIVDQLIEKNKIHDVADIYQLTRDDFLKLDLFAEKRAENLVNSIIASKKNPLHRLIFGLGIRNIGEKAALILAEKFNHFDALADADHEAFTIIPEIGPVMADSIISFFKLASTKTLISKLRHAGVNFTAEAKKSRSDKLSGMSIVVTGDVGVFSRIEVEELIREHGGKPSSSVSKKTDFVVIGNKPGSKKEKAEKLGVRIIPSDEFLKML